MSKLNTNAELAEAALKAAEENHIWVNAFRLIRPSDEVLVEIGRSVVAMMKQKENLLPTYLGTREGQVGDLQRLTPTLYMSINAS